MFGYLPCVTLLHTVTATHCNTLHTVTATHFNPLQHTATHCNTLQHTATHCNILQHTATHCHRYTYINVALRLTLPRVVPPSAVADTLDRIVHPAHAASDSGGRQQRPCHPTSAPPSRQPLAHPTEICATSAATQGSSTAGHDGTRQHCALSHAVSLCHFDWFPCTQRLDLQHRGG